MLVAYQGSKSLYLTLALERDVLLSIPQELEFYVPNHPMLALCLMILFYIGPY